jgi:hypothetical protein
MLASSVRLCLHELFSHLRRSCTREASIRAKMCGSDYIITLLFREEAPNVPVNCFRTGNFIEARPGITGGGQEAVTVGVVVGAVVAADGLEAVRWQICFHGNPDAFVFSDIDDGVGDRMLVEASVANTLSEVDAVAFNSWCTTIGPFGVDDDYGLCGNILEVEAYLLQPATDVRLGLLRREVGGKGVEASTVRGSSVLRPVIAEAVDNDVIRTVTISTAGISE